MEPGIPAAKIMAALRFAARKHRGQARKGIDSYPYIHHPIEVAGLLWFEGGVRDEDVIVAALLHDTVEDTDATIEQLEKLFGTRVRQLVEQVTDDMSLPKVERKQLQLETAGALSPGARLIRLADKISNVRDLYEHPPAGWSVQRRLKYAEWARGVVAGIRGTNAVLETLFDEALERLIDRDTPALNAGGDGI